MSCQYQGSECNRTAFCAQFEASLSNFLGGKGVTGGDYSLSVDYKHYPDVTVHFNASSAVAETIGDSLRASSSTAEILQAIEDASGFSVTSSPSIVYLLVTSQPPQATPQQANLNLNLIVAISVAVACIALTAASVIWLWRNRKTRQDLEVAELKESILHKPGALTHAETENPMVKQVASKVRYEAMFSYRVKTDEAVVSILLDKVKAAVAASAPRLFWDKVSLLTGQQWEEGFLAAIQSSEALVCMVSWYEGNSGSVGQMAQLDPDSGKDWQDNVLLEWEMGLIILERADLPLTSILPVFCGPVDSRGYQPFPFELLEQLPKAVSPATKRAVIAACERCGIELSDAERQRTIAGTVRSVLKFQGVKMQELGIERNANLATAGQIASAVTGGEQTMVV